MKSNASKQKNGVMEISSEDRYLAARIEKAVMLNICGKKVV